MASANRGGLLGQLFANKRLKPIALPGEGLWIGGLQRSNSRLVRWETIERVCCVPARRELGWAPSRGGIFVWPKGGSFVIHEQIQGFDDLWRELKEQLAQRGLTVEERSSVQ